MYLLDSTSNVSGGYFIGILILTVLIIIIQVLIIRWVFRIDDQVNNQRAMIWLLMKQWEKSGATSEEVEKFKKTFSLKK